MTEVPGRTSFDLENPFLKDWLDEQSLQLSGQVSQTTIDNLSDTLRDGIRAGEGMPDLTARVRGTFTDASRSRANLIARTEANKAANGASWTQATRSGVVKTKAWISASDNRVRPEHRILHGETVPLDKPFSNGLMFPSEPRCRCTLSYGIDSSKLTGPQPSVEEPMLGPPEDPAAWADERYADWADSLSTQQKRALSNYKNLGFKNLNKGLRSAAGEIPSKLAAKVAQLDSAIEAAPVTNVPLELFRGRPPTPLLDALATGDVDGAVGMEFADDAYMSTSLDPSVAQKFAASPGYPPATMRINVPAGSKMGYVDAHRAHVSGIIKPEQEMLLPRGSRIRVTGFDVVDGIPEFQGELIV